MILLKSGGDLLSMPIRVTSCDSFFKRMMGALSQGSISRNRAFWFPGVRRVHTVGMSEAIDLVYIDSNRRVVDYRPSLPPMRWYCGPSNSIGVLELAPNRISQAWLEKNPRIRFSEGAGAEDSPEKSWVGRLGC